MRILYATSPINIVIEMNGRLYWRRAGRCDQLLPFGFDPAGMREVCLSNGNPTPVMPDDASFSIQPRFKQNGDMFWQLMVVNFNYDLPFRLYFGKDFDDDRENMERHVRYLIEQFPKKLLSKARLQRLEIWANPQSVQRRANELEHEGMQGVKGFYDDKKQFAAVSLYGLNDQQGSGLNLYHELAHSIEYLVPADVIDQFRQEWPTFRENHFAYAMGSYLVLKNQGCLAVFHNLYPQSAAALDEFLKDQW